MQFQRDTGEEEKSSITLRFHKLRLRQTTLKMRSNLFPGSVILPIQRAEKGKLLAIPAFPERATFPIQTPRKIRTHSKPMRRARLVCLQSSHCITQYPSSGPALRLHDRVIPPTL